MDKYFTYQVHLHRLSLVTGEAEVHEFRDCTADQVTQLNIKAWTQGLRIRSSPQFYELVSPFVIKQIFVIAQDRKYDVT